MAAELEVCQGAGEGLGWAFGCWWASLWTPGVFDRLAYPLALASGAGLMTAYEWSADEGPITLFLLAVLSLGLGLLKPSRAVMSAIMLGLVVSSVLAVEALSGIRAAYEPHPVTLAQSLRWSVFLAPALIAALLGGAVGRRVRRAGGR